MLTFTVTEQQADQILNALGQRPYIESVGLIGVLMQQAQQQQAQAQQAQTGQASGAKVATPAQEQQVQKQFDAAEANRIGEAVGNVPQAVNGLDQRV
jgi:hypothetical protein